MISISDETIATGGYVFHGPGADRTFDELSAYFASLCTAFGGLRLVREQIVADHTYLAARITLSGDDTALFSSSPIGPVEPSGQHREWEMVGNFRSHGDGRQAEEWMQTDYRDFLTKLGVAVTESVYRGTCINPWHICGDSRPSGIQPERVTGAGAQAVSRGSNLEGVVSSAAPGRLHRADS